MRFSYNNMTYIGMCLNDFHDYIRKAKSFKHREFNKLLSINANSYDKQSREKKKEKENSFVQIKLGSLSS